MASRCKDGNVASNMSVKRASQIDAQNVEAGRRSSGIIRGGLTKLRPDQTVYEARVTHDQIERARGSLDSENSRRMIIKKGVDWSVDYDIRKTSSREGEDGT